MPRNFKKEWVIDFLIEKQAIFKIKLELFFSLLKEKNSLKLNSLSIKYKNLKKKTYHKIHKRGWFDAIHDFLVIKLFCWTILPLMLKDE